jgi:hypothetical protein
MKKIWSIIILLYAVAVSGQDIVDNPSKAVHPNAGRIIELTEMLQIRDASGKFQFVSPRNLQVNDQKEIFVLDRQQLLHFDSQGTFIRNYFRLGNGPGEVTSISNYQPFENGLIVHGIPPKILRYNDSGTLTQEIAMRTKVRLSDFQVFRENRYFFMEKDWSQLSGNEKVQNLPLQFYSVQQDGETLTAYDAKLSARYFFAQAGGERAIIQVDKQISVPWGEYLALISTPDYLISLFDLESGLIVRGIRREYDRVRSKGSGSAVGPQISLGGKTYGRPDKDYEDDIIGLVASGSNLWVINSRTTDSGGMHIDVFNKRGEFLDQFILRFKNGLPPKIYDEFQLYVDGSDLYAIMKGLDEYYYIGKFKLKDEIPRPPNPRPAPSCDF